MCRSSSTIERKDVERWALSCATPHPGEILKEEFLNEIGISHNRLAHAIGIPPNRVQDIMRCRRGIIADTDLRLSRFLGCRWAGCGSRTYTI